MRKGEKSVPEKKDFFFETLVERVVAVALDVMLWFRGRDFEWHREILWRAFLASSMDK